MRLFVAVALDAAVVSGAQSLAGLLRRRADELAPNARVTWIPPERLHLTIRFIGEAEDAAAAAISAALAAPIAERPFVLTLRGVGVFPPRGAPRVLWAGLQSGMDELRRLERAVNVRLAGIGPPPEDRPFSPHLTLARIRDAAGLRPRRWLDSLESHLLGTSRVDAITLYESRPSPQGPTYVPLQRTPLIPA